MFAVKIVYPKGTEPPNTAVGSTYGVGGVGRTYATFRRAKAAMLRAKPGNRGYAAIVDLSISAQIEPNAYGRYEGYE